MRGFWWLLLVAVAVGGCERDGGAPRAGGPEDEGAAVVSEAELVAAGDSAAVALTRSLMSRVQRELEAGGPTHAIEFCSENALPITAAVQDSIDRGLAVKRTSTRIRNPANAPDSLERQALAFFEAEREAGRALPTYHIQETEDGWRYYKPIVVADFCTRCHGPRESLEPGVRQVLAERYPDDQATGYVPGDFRGVIRVSIPAGSVRR